MKGEWLSWEWLAFQVVKTPEAYFYTDFTKTDGVVFSTDFLRVFDQKWGRFSKFVKLITRARILTKNTFFV